MRILVVVARRDDLDRLADELASGAQGRSSPSTYHVVVPATSITRGFDSEGAGTRPRNAASINS